MSTATENGATILAQDICSSPGPHANGPDTLPEKSCFCDGDECAKPQQTGCAERPVPHGLKRIAEHNKKLFGDGETHYALKEILGEGSFGSVYRCQRLQDSKICAAKIIDPRQLGFVGGEDGIRAVEAMAVREVDALRQLDPHPGIICLVDAFFAERTRQIFIVTEFVHGSHLFSHVVQRSEPFCEVEAAHIMAQLTDALNFCHSLSVVHRDLKLENVLVAACDVKAIDTKDECGEASCTTVELFTVKMCDFGFAKSLKGYSTATPIGTANYTAPEVEVDEAMGERTFEQVLNSKTNYNAFKADIFSLGVITFVMLTMTYPVKDSGEGAHRSHKIWPSLGDDVKSFIDGVLAIDPVKRFSVVQANNHKWVRTALQELPQENLDDNEVSQRSPRPRWGEGAKNHELQGILSLQRTFVMLQQERALSCWALAGAAGVGRRQVGDISCWGTSCWDDLRAKVALTDKRLNDAKMSIQPCGSDYMDGLIGVINSLTKARKLVFDNCPRGDDDERDDTCDASQVTFSTFDSAFLAYNHAIASMIELVAKNLEAVRPGSVQVRRAARRYRLFSTAVEQLGRERTWILGQGIRPVLICGSVCRYQFAPERLRRLGEILGARKVLLGTSMVNGAGDSKVSQGDVITTRTGLLGTLIGSHEAPLLSAAELSALETIEDRIIACDPTVSGEEFYQTLTRLMTSMHSRIAIDLVHDMCLDDRDAEAGRSRSKPRWSSFSFGKNSTVRKGRKSSGSRLSNSSQISGMSIEDKRRSLAGARQQQGCACTVGLRNLCFGAKR